MKRFIFLVSILFLAFMRVSGQAPFAPLVSEVLRAPKMITADSRNHHNGRKIIKEEDTYYVSVYSNDDEYGYVTVEIPYGDVYGETYYDTDGYGYVEDIEVEYGTMITLTAICKDDYLYRFVSWEDGETNPTRTIAISGDGQSYTAIFEDIPMFEICVSSNDADMGSVDISAHDPVDSYSDIIWSCLTVYEDTTITISATSTDDALYRFVHWNDGETANPRIVKATESVDYEAIFEEIPMFEICVSSNDANMGSVNISAHDPVDSYSDATWSCLTVYEDTTITISATSTDDALYRFVRWADGETANPRVVKATESVDYEAIFEEIPKAEICAWPIDEQGGDGSLMGRVDISASNYYSYDPHIDHGETIDACITVYVDTTVTITATSADDALYRFVRWADGETANPRVVKATESVDYEAIFEEIPKAEICAWPIDEQGDYDEGSTMGRVDVSAADYYSYNPYINHGETIDACITVYVDTMVTISATSADDALYRFVRWADGETVNPRVVKAMDSVDYEAIFEPLPMNVYTITISANDDFGYVYISIPEGDINGVTNYSTDENSGTITFHVQEGATIQLNADTWNDYLYYFTSWSDGESMLAHSEITVESDITLTANFKAYATCTITAVASPSDFVSIVSVDASDYVSDGDNWVKVTTGETVYLKVNEDDIAEGYTFAGWYDGDQLVSHNLSFPVTANADKTYTAKFEEIPIYTITISANDEYGYVNISIPEGDINGVTGYRTDENSGTVTFSVQEGATIQLYADIWDDYLYYFTSWSDGETVLAHSDITIGSDITLTANFGVNTTCTITAIADPSNAGSVFLSYDNYANEGEGWVEVTTGETVYLEVNEDNIAEGYTFAGWYDGDQLVSHNLSFPVTANADKIYTAKFEKTYIITAEADPSDAVAYVYAHATDYVSDGDNWVEVTTGKTVYLEVYQEDINYGYRFLGWYDGGEKVSSNLSFSVTANADKTYTAKFENTEKTLYLKLEDPSWFDTSGFYAAKYLDENGEYVWTDFMDLVEDERHIYSTTISVSFSELYFARFDEYAYDEGISDDYIEDIEQATLMGNQDDMYVITADGENYWANYSQLPFININKHSITINQSEIKSNATGSQTITVEGINLTEPISIAIHAKSEVFQANVPALPVEGGNVTVTYDVNATNTDIVDTLYITSSGLAKTVLLHANIFITEHSGTEADPFVPSEMATLQNRHYAFDEEEIYVKGEQYGDVNWSDDEEYHLTLCEDFNNNRLNCTIYMDDESLVKITPYGKDIISGDMVEVRFNYSSNNSYSVELIAYWPLPIDEEELAILRVAYSKMDNGATWTNKWDLTNTVSVRNSGSFEFDSGSITGIDLSGNGLEGTIPAELFQLPHLETLNISNNAIDSIEPYSNNTLTTLDISHNRIAELSAVVNGLPNLTELYYDDQVIGRAYTIFIEDTITSATLAASLPDILTFRSMPSGLWIAKYGESVVPEWQTSLFDTEDGYSWYIHSGHNEDFIYTPEDTLWVLDEENLISFPVFFTYAVGDADFSGKADVLDLQAEINYIFDEYYENAERPFNFTAANLYTDAVINVQDIIKMVSLLSSQELPSGAPMYRMYSNRKANGDVEAELYWSNGELHLNSSKPVAAMDIYLTGNNEIEWLVNTHTVSTTSTANGLHTIIYSLAGNTLPADTDIVIARTSDRQSTIMHAVLADKAAHRISAVWYEETESTPTSLENIYMYKEADTWTLYTVHGQKVAHGAMSNLANINSIISGQGGYLLMLQDKNNNVIFTGKLIIK